MDLTRRPSWSDEARNRTFYAAAWRWHFYAGLFVVPFLLTLAVTGMTMMISSEVSNQLGDVADLTPQATPLPVTAQAERALAAVPDGTLDQYAAPEGPERPAFFAIRQGDAVMSVAVNPYTGAILSTQDKTSTIYAIASGIHGKLMLGDTGDRIMEAAASLTLLMIVTGLWMWLPKAGLRRAFLPDLTARGRPLLKSVHAVLGTWVSLFLLLFVLSGLSWSGVWGERFVQPWSSFPAEKWDNVPLSDDPHASMNHEGHHGVPWGIEQTPMPASGSKAGEAAVSQPVTLDAVAAWAAASGLTGQYKIALPKSDKGVFTLMAETRNEDSVAPWQERTVHIDRYTGNLLADIRYDDYSLVAKLMAWGIGLHKGLAGTWNFVLNLIILCSVVTICATGIVMWWKRRPAGSGRLVAPPMPRDLPFWNGALLVALVLAMAFPMAGITLLAVVALDVLVLARLPVLKRALS